MSDNVNINWYPGHMAKTKKQIIEDLKLIDVVVEILDARIPISSRNPDIEQITRKKDKLIVLNKCDLADEKQNNNWVAKFKKDGIEAVLVNSNNGDGINTAIKKIEEISKSRQEKYANKGRIGKSIRVMIVGIPNVGKSSFINRLTKKNSATVGNKPGVTRQKQWIRINQNIELMDTPGVLWPKFDDLDTARNIALIGSIKQDILPLDELFIYAVEYLQKNYDNVISKRYNVEIDFDSDWVEKVYDDIAKNRKIKPIRGYTDYDRVMEIFFNDIFNGELGKITWELPDETL